MTDELDWQNAREAKFPMDLRHAAQEAERQTKVPTCLTLAQWSRESADGKHAAGAFNFFGLKWPELPTWRQGYLAKLGAKPVPIHTHEWIDGVCTPIVASFISFPSLASACLYHGQHLADPHGPYTAAYGYLGNDWQDFVHAVDRIYATDPAYDGGIFELITAYHLQDWNLPEYA